MARGGGGTRRCYAHPQDDAVTQCKLCGLAMCDRCYEHDVAGAPACGRCTHEAATRSQRAVSLGISLLGLGGAGVAWAVRAQKLTTTWAALAVPGVLLLAATVFAWVRSGSNIEIEARDRELERERDPHADTHVAHPYRQMARHMALRMSPKVSAGAVALALGASMVASAVLFPVALKLPRWAELEVVLGAWWGLVTLVLSVLLYRGYRLKDDWAFTSPLRSLFVAEPPKHGGSPSRSTPTKSSGGSGCDPLSGCDLGCSVPDEGFLVVLGAIVAAVLLAGAGWVLVEIALPIVLFAAYTGILAALKRVAHDRHGCEGNFLRAVSWGALWAGLYMLPLAVVVWVVHMVGAA